MNRRSFITGMAGILSAGYAPAFVGSSVLMPVKKVWVPGDRWIEFNEFAKTWNGELGRYESMRFIVAGFREKFTQKYAKFEGEWQGVVGVE